MKEKRLFQPRTQSFLERNYMSTKSQDQYARIALAASRAELLNKNTSVSRDQVRSIQPKSRSAIFNLNMS